MGDDDRYGAWLFEMSLRDIEHRVSFDRTSPEHAYQRLGIAPLLRKLLLDGEPLIQRIRRVHPDVPVVFTVGHVRRDRVTVTGDSVIGMIEPPQPVELGLKQFLGHPFMQVTGSTITVGDVIRHFAHVDGGVHLGKPQNDSERVLSRVAPMLFIGGGWTIALSELGRVTLAACAPLRAANGGHGDSGSP